MNGNSLKIITFLLVLNELQAWRSYVMDFTHYQYELNPEYVRDYDIKLIRDKGRNILNGTISLKQEISNLMIRFDVIIPRPENDWTLLNLTIDGCHLLQNADEKSANLPSIILGELRKTKKPFPKKCPVEKDKLFYAENIYLDAEKFPPYMPELKYNSVLVFLEGDEMVLKLLISGSVQSKSALRKNRSKTAPKSKQGS